MTMVTNDSRWRSLVLGVALFGCSSDPESARSDGGGGATQAPTMQGPGNAGQGGGPVELACNDSSAALTRIGDTPLRRLTRSQYNNVVREVFGVTTNPALAFAPDELAGPFPANSTQPVSRSFVQRLVETAESVAKTILSDPQSAARVVGCQPSESCAEQFIGRVAPRAFRRPISAEQLAALMNVYRAGAVYGADNGIRLVIEAILNAPDFLYHVEEKPDADAPLVALGSHELAARLAFFLWNNVPDAALTAKALDGSLQAPDVLRAEAERLLDDPRSSEGIANFIQYWLGISQVERLGRSQKDNIFATPELPPAMKRESLKFADFVIREGDGSLHTLLTAPFSFLEEPLFPVYGLSAPSALAADTAIGLPATERAGILTQPAFLAAHSHADHTSPVKRGVYILNNVLCAPVPLPEGLVIPELPDPDPSQSTRDRFAQHTSVPACAGCHQRMDPIGFALEHFDSIGMWRQEERPGVPANAVANIQAVHPTIDGEVNGAVELAHVLAASPLTASCMVKQWHRFSLARWESEHDGCAVERLEQQFSDSKQNLRELILGIVTLETFRYRPGRP